MTKSRIPDVFSSNLSFICIYQIIYSFYMLVEMNLMQKHFKYLHSLEFQTVLLSKIFRLKKPQLSASSSDNFTKFRHVRYILVAPTVDNIHSRRRVNFRLSHENVGYLNKNISKVGRSKKY